MSNHFWLRLPEEANEDFLCLGVAKLERLQQSTPEAYMICNLEICLMYVIYIYIYLYEHIIHTSYVIYQIFVYVYRYSKDDFR